MKQRAIYSDCLNAGAEFVSHLPSLGDWRQDAWERLCEARTMITAMRDYPPAELEVWLKHANVAHAEGRSFASILDALHAELLQKGFVKEGWWDMILSEVKRERAE